MENREILFRGKISENKKWAYGSLVKYHSFLLEKDVYSITDGYTNIRIDSETVGQFTGLIDKNGTKIFEGDIVKWDDESNGKYWRIAEVKINPSLCFDCSSNLKEYKGIINSSFKCYEYGNFIYRNTEKHLEITGNIHDKI